MKHIEFRAVENMKDYILGGGFEAKTYQKKGEIRARQGVIGETVITVMSDGMEETKNTVVEDENGKPGWVVTNPSGEQYIVKDAVFCKKYEKIEGTQDGFRPVWCPVTAVQIGENISFVAPWGENMNVVAGGYVVFDKEYKDVYGVQESEFNETYVLV